jgi:hypothetical protein
MTKKEGVISVFFVYVARKRPCHSFFFSLWKGKAHKGFFYTPYSLASVLFVR